MVDTQCNDGHDWQCDAQEHEYLQGWGQWQQKSWTQHGKTYGNYSSASSSGEESYITILLENMCIEQREHHKEEYRRRDTFEVAQKERFRVAHEYLTAQDNNFNNCSMYAIEQFNEVCQNMAFNHDVTQTNINNIIHYQNGNQHHYQQFYKKMCDFLDYEYGSKYAAWYPSRKPKIRDRRGRGHGH